VNKQVAEYQPNFDFGTKNNESFFVYIQRVQEEIDKYREFYKKNMSPALIEIILNIFMDQVFNTNNPKSNQVHELLRRTLNREPSTDDLNNLCILIQYKLEGNIEKQTKTQKLIC